MELYWREKLCHSAFLCLHFPTPDKKKIISNINHLINFMKKRKTGSYGKLTRSK